MAYKHREHYSVNRVKENVELPKFGCRMTATVIYIKQDIGFYSKDTTKKSTL